MSWSTEVKLYTIIWTTAVLYSLYRFAIESQILFSYVDDVYGDFKPGWTFLDQVKDAADFEWETLMYFIKRIYAWIFLQITLTESIAYVSCGEASKVSKYCKIFLSVLFIIAELGIIPLFIVLIQPILFTLVSFSKSIILIWFFDGICLISFCIYKEMCKNEEFLKSININEKQAYLIITTICWTNLRCVSYYLETIGKKSKENFLDFLEYCLYLPTLVFGPFINIKDYKMCYNKHSMSLEARVKLLVKDISRCLFWMAFLEFSLHFIYVNATSFQPQMVIAFGAWALYGYGYAMGQAFHIKYTVIYGISTKVATFEGINVPSLPKCIGRIHLYSDMWKYFDPGLHKFLVRYIYIPTIKNRKTGNKVFSSFLCFTFVYIWHGLEMYVLIWAFLNFVGVSVEILSGIMYEKYLKNSPLVQNIGEDWLRRIKCLLASPLLMMSAVSNFYFFAGSNIAEIFVMRILYGDYTINIVLLCILYCCCQVSTEIKQAEQTNREKCD